MQQAVKEMASRGYPLSFLSGGRERYGHFGYENGGQVRELPVNWFHGEPAIRKRMWSCYCALPFRAERSEREFAAYLTKSPIKVFYGGTGRRFAYVVLPKSGGDVLEQAGNPRTVLGILRGLAHQYGYREFKLTVPDTADLPAAWLNAARTWRIRSAHMIKILDLRATLAAYRDEIDAAFDQDGALTLRIEGQPPVCLRKQNGRLDILPGDARQAIILSEMDMVKLVFGTFAWMPPGIAREQARLMKAIFPLKFFIQPLDGV